MTLKNSTSTPCTAFNVLAALGLTAAFAAGAVNVSDLANKCSAGKQRACSELVQIATVHRDPAVRLEAVKHLTAQPVLAVIALNDAFPPVRLAAIQDLTDEATLAEIASHDAVAAVRLAAVVKLTSEAPLVIATRDPDPSVRETAAKRLDDVRQAFRKEQARLAEVALGNSDLNIRFDAVGAIQDPDEVARIAHTENNQFRGMEHIVRVRRYLTESGVAPEPLRIVMRIGYDSAMYSGGSKQREVITVSITTWQGVLLARITSSGAFPDRIQADLQGPIAGNINAADVLVAVCRAQHYPESRIQQVLAKVAVVDDSWYDAVSVLIGHGTDAGPEPPLYWAVDHDDERLVALLLSNGADVNAHRSWCHRSPLTFSRSSGVAALLLAHNASLTATDCNGQTPLFQGPVSVAELLISHGADVNARDKDGSTPLHDASHYGSSDRAAVLIAHGADVNTRNNNGETPLHAAAASGKNEIVALLVSYGADVNARRADGSTPVRIASLSKHNDVAEFLQQHGGRE